MVHHDLWEYDTVGPPILGDITVERQADQGGDAGEQDRRSLYVFDRATGKPVWPIEERPVPQSTVPGRADVADAAVPDQAASLRADRPDRRRSDRLHAGAARKQALDITRQFVHGTDLHTAVAAERGAGRQARHPHGCPGGTAAATGTPARSIRRPASTTPSRTRSRTSTTWSRRSRPDGRRSTTAIDGGRGGGRHTDIKGPQGLPLTKPPYGRITAIDMNRGEHVWMVRQRRRPARSSGAEGPQPAAARRRRPAGRRLLTKTLLFLGESSEALFGGSQPNSSGKKFRAYDKATGKVIWETELPAGTTGAPMTYLAGASSTSWCRLAERTSPAEWVALATSGTPAPSTTLSRARRR